MSLSEALCPPDRGTNLSELYCDVAQDECEKYVRFVKLLQSPLYFNAQSVKIIYKLKRGSMCAVLHML